MARKVTQPRNGYSDWAITLLIAKAMGVVWDSQARRSRRIAPVVPGAEAAE